MWHRKLDSSRQSVVASPLQSDLGCKKASAAIACIDCNPQSFQWCVPVLRVIDALNQVLPKMASILVQQLPLAGTCSECQGLLQHKPSVLQSMWVTDMRLRINTAATLLLQDEPIRASSQRWL